MSCFHQHREPRCGSSFGDTSAGRATAWRLVPRGSEIFGVEVVGKLGPGHDNLPLTPPPVASSIPAVRGHRPSDKGSLPTRLVDAFSATDRQGPGRELTALSARDLRLCPAWLAAPIMG